MSTEISKLGGFGVRSRGIKGKRRKKKKRKKTKALWRAGTSSGRGTRTKNWHCNTKEDPASTGVGWGDSGEKDGEKSRMGIEQKKHQGKKHRRE